MAYDIVSIDGVRINKISKRFPVEIQVDPHALNDITVHTGTLDDNQIPTSIMRTIAHQNDPHTMIIDGRDVSQDGEKLDTIEPGAEVNNLTDQQAQSLTGGSHSSWHHHDTWYYRKNELSTSGSSLVHWDNLTNVPATFTPSAHNHDDRYYTETEIDTNIYTKIELNNGQLDNRYYTETEVDTLLSNKSDITHTHDNRYYTETEINDLLDNKSDVGHIHDDRYYTETEIDTLLNNYSLSTHIHDDRYYTETELNSGQLDNRYYTETEADVFLSSKINKVSSPVVNNFVIQTSDGSLSDAAVNISSFAQAIHTHSADDITSGILPIVRGGTNNTTYTSARFIAFDGTKLASTSYSNSSFASASHNHSAANITSGTLVIARGGTNNTAYTSNKFLIYDGSKIASSVYDSTSFSLSNHTHTKSNITNFNESDYVHIAGNETITGNKTFSGDVTIQGTLTTINSTDLTVSDNEIILNSGETGAGISDGYSGLLIDRGTLDDAALRFDETDDKWKIGIGSSLIEISTLGHTHDDRYYTETEVDTLLNNYSLSTHAHDDRYYTETEIDDLLDNYYNKTEVYTKTECDTLFSPLVHDHDDLYYTESESDARYSLLTHIHDDRYYTETEVDTLLSNKSDITHTHDDRYYTETELQTSGLSSVHWDNLTNKPTTFTPSTHNHDDRYYTETELNNGQLDNRYYTETEINALLSNYSLSTHTHDDRYYTETEINNLLSNKSDVGHIHDDRYYTETEVNNLLSNKSDVGHTHDDRYYTETEINNNIYTKLQVDGFLAGYYTKVQLDNGQLDNRYYTETELNNGQLDNRYYTETEINNNYYTKTELNNGQLDNRYYTETELNSTSGAGYIGIDQIVGLTSDNVQDALEELNDKTANISSTLQDAYDAGKTINISTAPVKIESTNTNSPLELTNRSTTPTTNLAAGQIAVIDNELYIYDGGREKWLTPSKTLLFGKDGFSDGTNLRPVGQCPTSTTGYRMAKNGTIISATLQSNTSVNKNVDIRINESSAYTMGIVGGVFNSSLNINFSANDVISIYVNAAGSSLQEAVSVLEFAWRK